MTRKLRHASSIAKPTAATPTVATHTAAAPVLQRKCACGGTPGPTGECAQCRQKRLQRRAARAASATHAPPIVHEVLRSPGQPLDASARAFMEPRFGHDFSQVRVHADAGAARSAAEVGAHAYTVGRNVVFGAGQYAPHTSAGRDLLAHELTHVLQQRGLPSSGPLPIGAPDDALERAADRVSNSVLTGRVTRADVWAGADRPTLRRKLTINPNDMVPMDKGLTGTPTPLPFVARSLMQEMCPEHSFQVDLTSGVVSAQNSTFCQQPPPKPPTLVASRSKTPVGCGCLCDVINSPQTTTVGSRAGGPSTTPTSGTGTVTSTGAAGTPANTALNIDPNFHIQNSINGKWVDVPLHIVFTHELCGHARSLMSGTQVPPAPGPAGGTPPHERVAVDVERAAAAEHNPPLPRRPEDYSASRRRP